MDIQAEKANIIKRFEQVNDITLIKTIKNLLDYAFHKEAIEVDKALESSIDQGLAESAKGEGRSHKKVMVELREKYKGWVTKSSGRGIWAYLRGQPGILIKGMGSTSYKQFLDRVDNSKKDVNATDNHNEWQGQEP